MGNQSRLKLGLTSTSRFRASNPHCPPATLPIPAVLRCQGRSKTRPQGRSKSRPEERVEDRGLSGRRASGAKACAPMVKKLILAVKEGEFPVVGYFAGLPFLLSSSHAQHSIEEGGADSSRSSVGMVIKCPHAR